MSQPPAIPSAGRPAVPVPVPPAGRDLLAGKVVVITAAAGTGIGSATARRCLAEGAQVVIGDHHARRLAAAHEERHLPLHQGRVAPAGRPGPGRRRRQQRLGARLAGPAGPGALRAAKAGVMALTRCAALDVAGHGIRVNAVAPSLAVHPFLAKVTSEEVLAELTGREAFGRAAQRGEVASVIVFLASDYASYLTGEVISVSSQHP